LPCWTRANGMDIDWIPLLFVLLIAIGIIFLALTPRR
jgi:hypothetical protein